MRKVDVRRLRLEDAITVVAAIMVALLGLMVVTLQRGCSPADLRAGPAATASGGDAAPALVTARQKF